MEKIKGFLFAVRHREILMTDLGLKDVEQAVVTVFQTVKGGSVNYHRKLFSYQPFYVLSSCGLFLVQFSCSFSRIARYTPSLTNKLTSKIVSQSVKANL